MHREDQVGAQEKTLPERQGEAPEELTLLTPWPQTSCLLLSKHHSACSTLSQQPQHTTAPFPGVFFHVFYETSGRPSFFFTDAQTLYTFQDPEQY